MTRASRRAFHKREMCLPRATQVVPHNLGTEERVPERELLLLGTPRLVQTGEPVMLETRKALSLLCYLVVTGNAHSRESLAALFRPEMDKTRARGSLRRALHALRRACSDLDADAQQVRWKPRAELWVDGALLDDARARNYCASLDEFWPKAAAWLPATADPAEAGSSHAAA